MVELSVKCPCEYCYDFVFKSMKSMLDVVFDWLYFECKFDDSKTYTWKELMYIYLLLREMNIGKTLKEAEIIAKKKVENDI